MLLRRLYFLRNEISLIHSLFSDIKWMRIFKSFLSTITIQCSFPRDASSILQKMDAKLYIFFFQREKSVVVLVKLVDFSDISCCRHQKCKVEPEMKTRWNNFDSLCLKTLMSCTFKLIIYLLNFLFILFIIYVQQYYCQILSEI